MKNPPRRAAGVDNTWATPDHLVSFDGTKSEARNEDAIDGSGRPPSPRAKHQAHTTSSAPPHHLSLGCTMRVTHGGSINAACSGETPRFLQGDRPLSQGRCCAMAEAPAAKRLQQGRHRGFDLQICKFWQVNPRRCLGAQPTRPRRGRKPLRPLDVSRWKHQRHDTP